MKKRTRSMKTIKKVSKIKSGTSSSKTVHAEKVSQSPAVKPLGSRVLIKPFSKEELMKKNSFGIILPDVGLKAKSEQGVVLAVGVGEYRDGKFVQVSIKVGDKVIFSKYGYEDVNVDGEELYLIKEENVLAVLK